jgi:hypothetical protein
MTDDLSKAKDLDSSIYIEIYKMQLLDQKKVGMIQMQISAWYDRSFFNKKDKQSVISEVEKEIGLIKGHLDALNERTITDQKILNIIKKYK